MPTTPPLIEFIRSWSRVANLRPLKEEEWFVEGHGIVGGRKDEHGIWIPSHAPNGKTYWWDPPQVIANIALEEAMKATHKRTDAYHLFSVPHLFTPSWTQMFTSLQALL